MSWADMKLEELAAEIDRLALAIRERAIKPDRAAEDDERDARDVEAYDSGMAEYRRRRLEKHQRTLRAKRHERLTVTLPPRLRKIAKRHGIVLQTVDGKRVKPTTLASFWMDLIGDGL